MHHCVNSGGNIEEFTNKENVHDGKNSKIKDTVGHSVLILEHVGVVGCMLSSCVSFCQGPFLRHLRSSKTARRSGGREGLPLPVF